MNKGPVQQFKKQLDARHKALGKMKPSPVRPGSARGKKSHPTVVVDGVAYEPVDVEAAQADVAAKKRLVDHCLELLDAPDAKDNVSVTVLAAVFKDWAKLL